MSEKCADHSHLIQIHNCAAGVRLDGFLAESDGPIRVPSLSCFATVSAFSSAQSGSGNLQIELKTVRSSFDDASLIFFLSRFLDHQNAILSDETRKRTSEKVILSEYVHRTAPNLGQDQIAVWLKQHFANELLWWPA